MKIKKILLPLFLFLLFTPHLFSALASISVFNTGFENQYLEAATANNPVFHFTVHGTDTMTALTVKNTLNSLGYGLMAGQPASIVAGGVKVWIVSPDSPVFNPAGSTTSFITAMSLSSGATQWTTGTIAQPVAEGDGIWVTADIQGFPDFGIIQMQTVSAEFLNKPGFVTVNEPPSPPSLYVTSSTAANNLEIYHSGGNMQSFVSTGQDNIIAGKLFFTNNSGTDSAPVQINSITITVDSSQVPDEIISSIKIQDQDQGIIYGEISGTYLPSDVRPIRIPVNINIPANTTVTANVVIKITDNPSSADESFAITLESGADVDSIDAYTGKPCPVNPAPYDSFPLQSTFAAIKKKATQLNVDFDGTYMPPNINKGQTNNTLSVLTLTNPGDASSAYIEVTSIRIHVKDSLGNPIVPKDIFSKISLVSPSGDATYGFKTSSTLETSGSTITIPLANPVSIAPASYNKVTIKADIAAAAIANNFSISIEALTEIQARDKNSFISVPAASASSLPFNSNLALLTSSFKVNHIAAMPKNIYKSQSSIQAAVLAFTSPMLFGGGSSNILIHGVTITSRDSAGTAVNASSVLSSLSVTSQYWTLDVTSMPAGGLIYLEFPSPLLLSSANTSESVTITAALSGAPQVKSLQLVLDSASMVSANQDTDPNREIYISALTGDSFPMSSGTGFIASESSASSFSGYPNPFRPGTPAKFAYYLDSTSKVTIKIYDLTGALIATVVDGASKAQGSHSDDSWDGKNSSGRTVMAGTYLAQIVIKPDSGSEKKSVKKITFVK